MLRLERDSQHMFGLITALGLLARKKSQFLKSCVVPKEGLPQTIW